MSFSDAQEAIESRFDQKWESQTRVIYENMEWPDPKSVEEFVRLTVAESKGEVIELRQRALSRYNGTIILQVFTIKGKGTRTTSMLADRFGDIFRRAEFSLRNSGLIRCRTPDKMPIGLMDGWYVTNVGCDYQRDVYQTRASEE